MAKFYVSLSKMLREPVRPQFTSTMIVRTYFGEYVLRPR